MKSDMVILSANCTLSVILFSFHFLEVFLQACFLTRLDNLLVLHGFRDDVTHGFKKSEHSLIR